MGEKNEALGKKRKLLKGKEGKKKLFAWRGKKQAFGEKKKRSSRSAVEVGFYYRGLAWFSKTCEFVGVGSAVLACTRMDF